MTVSCIAPYEVRATHRARVDLFEPMVVDNFAGGGGASLGMERALGRAVDLAINHDALAVRCHELNHPRTEHLQADVFEVCPRTVTEGRPVGLASPNNMRLDPLFGGALAGSMRRDGCTDRDIQRAIPVRDVLGPAEPAFGDFRDGRYGWCTSQVVRLAEPIPFKGRQGLFDIPDDLTRRYWPASWWRAGAQ